MKVGKEILEGLTEGMRARVLACETAEELEELLGEEGLDLADELLGEVDGGAGYGERCPKHFKTWNGKR